MSTQNVSLSRLIWRDAVQVASLLIATLVGGLVVITLILLFTEGRDRQSFLAIVSVVLPYLFVFGAPAMLIGQEFEQGTLAWTRTLPISWQQAFASKWIIGMAGLLMLWALAGVTYLVGEENSHVRREYGLEIGLGYFLPALLAMAVGFAVSWKICRPFPSLFVTAGIFAALVTLLENVLVSNRTFIATDTQLTIRLAVAIAIGFACSIWFARQTWMEPWSFRPWWDRAPTLNRNVAPRAITRSEQREATITRPIPSPFGALVWQHAAQSRFFLYAGMLTSVVAVCFIAPITYNKLSHHRIDHSFHMLAPLFYALSPMLLGISTFITDNHNNQFRFLSDRGLSTFTIWATRQVVPFSIFCIFVLSYSLISFILKDYTRYSDAIERYTCTITSFTAASLLLYAIGQWCALLFQRLIMVLAITVLGSGALAITLFQIADVYANRLPFALFLLLGALWLWITTLFLTRRWSEGDRSFTFYGCGLALIASSILFTFGATFAWRWAITPPAEPEWQAIVARNASTLPPPSGGNPYEFGQPSFLIGPPLNNAPTLEIFLLNSKSGSSFYNWLDDHGNVAIPHELTSIPSDNPQRYLKRLEALFRSIQATRQSQDLFQLAAADQLELMIASELTAPDTAKLLSKTDWQRAIDQLATRDERDHARRVALIRSFSELHSLHYKEDRAIPSSHELYQYFTNLHHEYAIERRRTRRLLDVAGRMSWQALEKRTLAPNPDLRQAWAAASQPTQGYEYLVNTNADPTTTWTEDLEQKIADAKSASYEEIVKTAK